MADLHAKVFDVAVIGAGPAGSSAASALAKGGAKVLLLEKACLPRYKTCGGGLVNRAHACLSRNCAIPVERECYAAELNFLKHGLHFETRRREPIVFMTMRSALDHELALEAQRAGAEVEQGCALTSIRILTDRVELGCSRRAFHAKFIVGADGASSSVARLAGWKGPLSMIPALECEVFVRERDFDRLSQAARFDFELIPHGYAWVFPKKEHLSVGVLSTKRGPVNLHETLGRYLKILGINAPEKIERHGYVIPIKPRKGGVARGRILLAGDAAGFVDPVTAEGMTYGIRSGELAAQALMESAFDPSQVAPRYQTLVGNEILPELRAGRVLAWMLYRHPRLAAWLMRRHGTAFSELATKVVMGEKTYRGAMREIGSYLKLFRRTNIPHGAVRVREMQGPASPSH